MLEPFMMPAAKDPGDAAYSVAAPVEFKDPSRKIWLVPMDGAVMAGDRPLYSRQECEADQKIWKTAIDNTARISLRISTDKDMASVRSTKAADTPCAAVLLLPGKNRRARLMRTVSDALKEKNMPPAQEHYFMFVTPDEILLADKAKFRPSVLRKTMRSIRNRLASTDPNLVLSTEVLEYDAGEDVYREV